MTQRIYISFLFGIVLVIGFWFYGKSVSYQLLLTDLLNYQTTVTWLADLNPTTRVMEQANKHKIALDYTNAWKQHSICLLTGDTTVLYSYFVPNLRTIITKNAQNLASKKVTIIQKDIKHTLQLRFYSLDGQVITLSDSVQIYQKINGVTRLENRYYDILLMLEEGHWRVKNWVWQ